MRDEGFIPLIAFLKVKLGMYYGTKYQQRELSLAKPSRSPWLVDTKLLQLEITMALSQNRSELVI